MGGLLLIEQGNKTDEDNSHIGLLASLLGNLPTKMCTASKSHEGLECMQVAAANQLNF